MSNTAQQQVYPHPMHHQNAHQHGSERNQQIKLLEFKVRLLKHWHDQGRCLDSPWSHQCFTNVGFKPASQRKFSSNYVTSDGGNSQFSRGWSSTESHNLFDDTPVNLCGREELLHCRDALQMPIFHGLERYRCCHLLACLARALNPASSCDQHASLQTVQYTMLLNRSRTSMMCLLLQALRGVVCKFLMSVLSKKMHS